MNTTYFLNCVAGNLFHTKEAPAIPTQYYIGLSSSTPAIDGSGVNEPSTDAGYQRLLLTNLSSPLTVWFPMSRISTSMSPPLTGAPSHTM